MSFKAITGALLESQPCKSEECHPFKYDLPFDVEEKCSHPNCVEDENLVCTDCGLVISNIFQDASPGVLWPNHSELPFEKSPLYNKVQDLAHILHLDETSFSEEILSSIRMKPSWMRDDEALVFYTYDYLIKAKNYIKFPFLCKLCGVSEKKMSRYTFLTCGFSSDDLISKSCKLFNLTYSEEKLLKNKMAQKKISGHAPATVLGGYLFSLFSTKLTMKKICTVLNINSVSVRRYIKSCLE